METFFKITGSNCRISELIDVKMLFEFDKLIFIKLILKRFKSIILSHIRQKEKKEKKDGVESLDPKLYISFNYLPILQYVLLGYMQF